MSRVFFMYGMYDCMYDGMFGLMVGMLCFEGIVKV